MPFTLSHERERNFIRLTFRLPDTFQEHEEARQGILRHIKQHQCRRILVDFSAMNAPTRMNKKEQFTFTQNWNGRDFRYCVFAILLPEESQCQDDWYFMTYLIREKGVVGQPFSQAAKAVAWLCEEGG
ncbi:MAG: hypothetical protein KDI30_12810 [Pseudomonadales bacterium]|nr:hypothetical protein [Pseudomonadales bacterium]